MIRQAHLYDAAQIAQVHVQSWHETYQDMVHPDILANLDVAEKTVLWTQLLQDKHHHIWVYEQDEKILGFLDGYLSKQSPVAEIRAFYLLKTIQKQGIGRQLFERFYQMIDLEKYQRLILDVFEQNPSRHFYEKLGATVYQVEDASDYGAELKLYHYQWEIEKRKNMSDQQYLTDLQEEVRKAKRFKYLGFWGHTPKQKGVVDKSCFSQWFPSAFEVEGIAYKNAEQFMMAQKAKLFGDDEIFQKILHSSHPKEVKALGRLVKKYQEDVWQQHRFAIVVAGNVAKFSQNQDLKQFLLGTGERVLVEASPVDKIWGIGLATDHENAEKPLQWKGLNLLGFALMQVRDQIAST